MMRDATPIGTAPDFKHGVVQSTKLHHLVRALCKGHFATFIERIPIRGNKHAKLQISLTRSISGINGKLRHPAELHVDLAVRRCFARARDDLRLVRVELRVADAVGRARRLDVRELERAVEMTVALVLQDDVKWRVRLLVEA